jgi:hypothetical protein
MLPIILVYEIFSIPNSLTDADGWHGIKRNSNQMFLTFRIP